MTFVVTGSVKIHDKNHPNHAPHIQVHPIRRIIEHEAYDQDEFRNDIALLELNTSICFDNFTQPVCLPNANESYLGHVCRSSGWGSMQNEDTGKHEENGSTSYFFEFLM